jgi:hypothetical protein
MDMSPISLGSKTTTESGSPAPFLSDLCFTQLKVKPDALNKNADHLFKKTRKSASRRIKYADIKSVAKKLDFDALDTEVKEEKSSPFSVRRSHGIWKIR